MICQIKVVNLEFLRSDGIDHKKSLLTDGVMIGLDDLAGGSFSSATNDVSADGSVIVGVGRSANGKEAFVWESLIANTISADGLTIVGKANALASTAFVASIGPSLVPAAVWLMGYALEFRITFWEKFSYLLGQLSQANTV